MFLNYFALGVLIFVFLVIFYGIIILHDIPYLIAKKRNHPQATLYRPERGWGMQSADSSLIQLQARVADLEKKLGEAKTSPAE